jgi:hypothetical protein
LRESILVFGRFLSFVQDVDNYGYFQFGSDNEMTWQGFW